MEVSKKSRTPIASVIVPIFNAEKFVEESIESVLAQSFADWELILVDDGSDDDGPALSQHYAQKFPHKIKYVAHRGQRNLGVSASRNLGIKISRGRFLNFLDADDVWLPGHLEAYVALLQRHPDADAAFGRSKYWFSWDPKQTQNQHQDFTPPVGRVELERTIDSPQLLVRMLSGEIAVPVPCSVMVKREAIVDIGGFEDRFRGAYEDQVFYSKLFLSCKTVVTDACFDLYRQHPASLTAVSRDRSTETIDRRRFLEWLSGHLDSCGVSDPQLLKALEVAKWRLEHPSLNRWRWKLSQFLGPKSIFLPVGEKASSPLVGLVGRADR